MEVNYSWAERSIPWLIAMDAFVSSDDGGPLAISDFPEGARMWPERVIEDAAGNYIGRWDIDLDSGMLAVRLQDGDVKVEMPVAEFFMTAEAAKVGRVLP